MPSRGAGIALHPADPGAASRADALAPLSGPGHRGCGKRDLRKTRTGPACLLWIPMEIQKFRSMFHPRDNFNRASDFFCLQLINHESLSGIYQYTFYSGKANILRNFHLFVLQQRDWLHWLTLLQICISAEGKIKPVKTWSLLWASASFTTALFNARSD